MRERIVSVDGELNIDSRPGEGTRIQVRVPLKHASDAGLENEETRA